MQIRNNKNFVIFTLRSHSGASRSHWWRCITKQQL